MTGKAALKGALTTGGIAFLGMAGRARQRCGERSDDEADNQERFYAHVLGPLRF